MKKYITILSMFATAFAFADGEFYDDQTISKDFSNQSMNRSSWKNCKLSGSIFNGTKLQRAKFDGASFGSFQFTNCDLTKSSFTNTRISEISEMIFDGCKMENINFAGAGLGGPRYATKFLNISSLRNVDFTSATLASAFNASIGYTSYANAVDFSNIDMTGCNFSNAVLAVSKYEKASVKFDNSVLTKTNFTGATLSSWGSSVNFSNVDLKEADFTNAVMIFDEKRYSVWTSVNMSNSDLRGAKFDNVVLGGENTAVVFAKSNLQNVSLKNVVFSELNNFFYADLRGGDLTGARIAGKTLNTIWVDGEIKNFSLDDDYLSIRKYVPATSGGTMINAKIADDASISGGAVLTLEQGAVLEIASGKTLSVLDDSEIIFNVDAATDATKILLGENSKLAFGSDSKITINLDGIISSEDSYTFSVIEMAVGSQVTGTDSLKKENVILNVNGEEYDSSKWNFDFDSSTGALNINVNVPEPAEWAMIFGVLALGFAVYRRRK